MTPDPAAEAAATLDGMTREQQTLIDRLVGILARPEPRAPGTRSVFAMGVSATKPPMEQRRSRNRARNRNARAARRANR